MYRLAWATDIHLDHLPAIPDVSERFATYLVEQHDPNALLVTGDITLAPMLEYHLDQLEDGLLGLPLYFVLGNHDYYRGSLKESAIIASAYRGWLNKPGYHELMPNVALVGHEGWYDAYCGAPYSERFGMSDWLLIQEYSEIPNTILETKFQQETPPEILRLFLEARKTLIEKARERSTLFAAQARVNLEMALKHYEWVVFATHYPPFKEACWHEGHMSNDLFLPWFTSKHMGDMLLEVAAAHPDRKIIVLCGHSHSSGIYEALPNLIVYTGEAVYGAPDVTGILEIDDSGILIRMKLNKHWTTIAPFLKRAPV